MKIIIRLVLLLLVLSCSNKQSDLIVKANIKGLKKGTVYLKKLVDSTLVTVDSVIVNGNSNIELTSDLESPDLFYLDLDKNSAENERITFFADKGTTNINTTLKQFVFDADIQGSEQQKIWAQYQLLMSRLNNRNLDIIKESFDAAIGGDSLAKENYNNKYNSLVKARYLQTVNFALQHKDSEVAPYLAVTQIYDARKKYLDTIYNTLTANMQDSKYGKRLKGLIDSRTEE